MIISENFEEKKRYTCSSGRRDGRDRVLGYVLLLLPDVPDCVMGGHGFVKRELVLTWQFELIRHVNRQNAL
jgi:hypothetical protein